MTNKNKNKMNEEISYKKYEKNQMHFIVHETNREREKCGNIVISKATF